ncbi:MAG: FKBP-type peptidyl-prolyl cis-trans isomerase [Myxococcota bacterium]|jgi:peptidylprolyl isomerase|nr:FKBP-type peptidyl-prolyl cis-trans isomerase [Myxococcota bacterium]
MKHLLPLLALLLCCGCGPKKRVMTPPARLENTAPPAEVATTGSGLRYLVLVPGDGGRRPLPTSMVTVHYTGWTMDGEQFDSSLARGVPASFPLDKVIPGWSEGVQLMTVGQKNRFWIPEHLAYQGRPGPPQGMLVFDVELIEIR